MIKPTCIPTYDTHSIKYGKSADGYLLNLLKDLAYQFSFCIVKDSATCFVARRMTNKESYEDSSYKFEIKVDKTLSLDYTKASFVYQKSSRLETQDIMFKDDLFKSYNVKRTIEDTGASCMVNNTAKVNESEVDGWVAYLFHCLMDFHVCAWKESGWSYGDDVHNPCNDNYLSLPISEKDYLDESLWNLNPIL